MAGELGELLMKRHARRLQGKASLELLEEAFHLLRSAPLSTLALYYTGALPFVLGLLWFWADMSQSPFAYHHLDAAALALAGLFLWMKCWQAVYARSLRAAVAGGLPPLGPGAVWRLLVTQAALQPTGLLLWPLALMLLFPFPYAFAFYQNLTALADGEPAGLGAEVRRAMRQTSLQSRQNLLLLLVLLGFGFIVFLNWTTFCFLLPGLAKMLFGLESVFTRSGVTLLNTTFFATMFGLTYLSVDPLVKAAYTLRCFYGESLQSGADLKSDLKRFAPAGAAVPVVLAFLLTLSSAANAQPPSGPDSTGPKQNSTTAAAPALSAPELDRAIQEVVRQDKYTWRMPREKIAKPETERQGVVGRFLERVFEMIGRALKSIWHGLESFLRKLFQGQTRTRHDTSGYGWIMLLQLLPYLLIAAAAAGLGYLVYRLWLSRYRLAPAIAGEPVQPAPDLSDENVGADQLPEDGWTRLARELLARGELRLAMRAFYLASLAHLSERNLISLARFKSNRDYERELGRRGHAFPGLLDVFGENVAVFERIWYGMHEVSGDLVTRFAANVERIRSGDDQTVSAAAGT